MKNIVKLLSLICFIIVATMICCTTSEEEPEETNNLEGVWKFVSGEYTIGDSTIVASETYPYMKSYRFFTNTRYAVLSQDTSTEFFRCVTGPYRLTEDTYVEHFEIIENLNAMGDSAVFKYTLDGDKWTITSDWLKEEWKRIE